MTDNPFPADGPKKPALSDPCNGCGLCCVATPCAVALDFVPEAKAGHPCPALEWQDGRSWCGMVRNPAKHSPELATRIVSVLGAGYDVAAAAAMNRRLGDMIREDLGGASGCDSGNPDADDEHGMTAAEYHEIAYRPSPIETPVLRLLLALRGYL